MKELPDYPNSGRQSNNKDSVREIDMDPRRGSYTSSTVGSLNSGSFPLASLKPVNKDEGSEKK